jgi:TonB family protein
MMHLLDRAIEVALILGLALAAMPLLARRSAALRHWVLTTAVIGAAAAPLLGLIAPAWQLPVDLAPASVVMVNSVPDAGAGTASSHAAGVSGRSAAPLPASLLLGIWLTGVVLGAGGLAVGLTRLLWLSARSRAVTNRAWASAAREISDGYGLRPPRLLVNRGASLLVTWGVRRATVLLPGCALSWPESRVRLVLAHELAHIRRGDWIVQLAVELLSCVYWFNPLVWIARARLRRESEQACDDAVINGGADGPDYATHLVNIARELQRSRLWVPAPSIARASHLERRVRTMLDHRTDRRPVSRTACAAALAAMLALVIPLSGAAVAQVFATVAGSVVDPMNAALPGVTLVLTNTQTQAKHEVKSNRDGRYEFVGLPAGDYQLEAKLPGFAVLKGTLTVAGQAVQQDLRLEVGTLQETINIRANRNNPGVPPPTAGQRAARKEPPSCAQTGATGGNIRPPMKLYHVNPHYPASALNAGAEGTVNLEARIDASGAIDDVTVVSTPHPDLAAASTDAVRQWEFNPTYLNCVAIPVKMRVALHFAIEK